MSSSTTLESIQKGSETDLGYGVSIAGIVEKSEPSTSSFDSKFAKYKPIPYGLEPIYSERRKRKTPIVLRKFNGYFVQQESEEALVVLLSGGELYKYYLPYRELKNKGIYLENQPFEMIELKLDEAGVTFKGYDYKPLATEKDSFNVEINLDEDRKKKLKYIIKNAPKLED